MQEQNRSSLGRWIVLLLTLLLVPALCVVSAFAMNLQITSPYFTLSFGPHQASDGAGGNVATTGGPNLVGEPPQVQPPSDDPPNTGGPSTPTDGTPTQGQGNGCLLGLLCLDVDAGVDGVPALNLNLSKDGQQPAGSTLNLNLGAQGTQTQNCLLGLICLGASEPAAAGGAGGQTQECLLGAICADADLELDGGGAGDSLELNVQAPALDSGADIDLNLDEGGVELDADLDLLGGDGSQTEDGLDLDLGVLEVGLGGAGGVSLNLGGLGLGGGN